MEKLLTELRRLYLPADAATPEALARHVTGQTTLSTALTGADGLTRALVIAFNQSDSGAPEQHWNRLCEVANALQGELGLPAPAVSISGASGYGLWLSFEQPLPAAEAQQFADLLQAAYFPEIDLQPPTVSTPVEVPPCLHRASGKWAAFIHPGMGASFAEDAGLEMAPPLSGQLAFLEGLRRIGADQLAQALATMRRNRPVVKEEEGLPEVAASQALQRGAGESELLLRDATLEDIVRHLHARKIEPTFRHLLK